MTAVPPAAPGGTRRSLVLLAVAALPFTLALTIRLQFPLKIYELALLGAGLLCLAQLRLPTIRSAGRAVLPMLALIAFGLGTLLLHVWLPLPDTTPAGIISRFGPLGDGLAKLAYLSLAIFGFLLIARRVYAEEETVTRLWLYGAVAACAYAWYLFLSSLAGIAPVRLPGMESPQMISFAGRLLIRSGTFEEGNYFGLFLVLSTAVALFSARRRTALFLSASMLTTFSTVNVVGLSIVWLLHIRRSAAHLPPKRRALYIGLIVGALAAAAGALVATGYLQSVVFEKVAGEDTVSRFERLNQAVAGLRMFLAHPWTGVGVAQYGFFYDRYGLFDLSPLATLLDQKRIANNVFVELLAETGLPGLLLFGAFLYRVFRSASHPDLAPLRSAFIAVLLALNAFPTYSVMFLWAFFALVVGAAARRAPTTEPAV